MEKLNRGVSLGNYILVNSLTENSFFSTWKALHKGLNTLATLKVTSVSNENALNRFRRETRILQKLARLDTGIERFQEAGQEGDFSYIATGFLEVESLQEFSDARRTLGFSRAIMTTREVAAVFRSISDTLECIHAENIIHCNLQPANVLIEKTTGKIIIHDFGMARSASDLEYEEVDFALFNTSVYTSPEQLREIPASKESDQYALAAIIYELLTGRPPFNPPGKDPLTILSTYSANLIKPPGQFVSGLPEEVNGVLLKALDNSKGSRFAGVNQFYEAFSRALYGDNPPASDAKTSPGIILLDPAVPPEPTVAALITPLETNVPVKDGEILAPPTTQFKPLAVNDRTLRLPTLQRPTRPAQEWDNRPANSLPELTWATTTPAPTFIPITAAPLPTNNRPATGPLAVKKPKELPFAVKIIGAIFFTLLGLLIFGSILALVFAKMLVAAPTANQGNVPDSRFSTVIDSGFEANQPTGAVNKMTVTNMQGYAAGVGPEAGYRPNGDGDVSTEGPNNSGFFLVAGSKADPKLPASGEFTIFDGSAFGSTTIVPNMKFSYSIYQFAGGPAITTDILFADNTRASTFLTANQTPLKDTNGVALDVKSRNLPDKTWENVEVDLTPLAGKKVSSIVLVWDGSAPDAKFLRVYLDNIRIGL